MTASEGDAGGAGWQRQWRLIEKKERWGLTWRGILLLVVLVAAGSAVLFFNAYPLLAPTAKADSDIAVVEGWISLTSARRAAEWVQSNRVSMVLVGGGPILDAAEFHQDITTYADLGFQRLSRAGLPASLMTAIPSAGIPRDRTYTEALAIKSWLASKNITPSGLNVISEAVHARRSRLLFRKAFGPGVPIGVIALPPREYPANGWWRYSAGVKEVISEAAAYVYVRFFFWP